MRARFGWLFVGLMACTSTGTAQNLEGPPPEPTPTPAPTVAPEEMPESTPPPATTPAATLAVVTVQMTAATLADDCGGPPPASKAKRAPSMKGDMAGGAAGRRACEQSSMQLSVVAAADSAPTRITVKQVELLDDKGAMIGELTARMPSVWDQDGAYQAWDQSIAPGQDLSVSYALSQPPWDDVPNRRSRTYLLRALITIGDGEQSVQRDVRVAAPTALPPNVRT